MDSPALVDVLKAKAMLLLRRERELESLRRERDRTVAWLRALHRLIETPLHSTTALEQEGVALLIRELGFQTAAVFRLDIDAESACLVAGQSRVPLPARIAVDSSILLEIAREDEGASANSTTPLAETVARAVDLHTYVWAMLSNHGNQDVLVAGFNAAAAASQLTKREDDLPYFRMLARHLSVLVRNRRLLAELEREQRELQTRNQQYAETNRQLEQSLCTLRETQAQLLQTSKMAAVGQLAAGVSHEINNPLGVILGFAQGLEKRLNETTENLRLPVTSIVREALRCKALVQDLLVFSRTPSPLNQPTDLRALLGSVQRLLESRARTQGTLLVLEMPESAPAIEVNQIQIEQVVINLGINALDALGRGGQLTLRLCADDPVSLVIEVQDTGPGIPEEIRERVFEPFFTTKEVGKGTGLGLSLAYEIAKQHGGKIEVVSETGRGTTMKLYLPRKPSEPDASGGR